MRRETLIIKVSPERLEMPRSHNDPTQYPSASTWQTIVRMLGRRGLYSISICTPRGSKSVQVRLVLGIPCRSAEIIFVMGVRKDASSNGAKHSHWLAARANLLVMGGGAAPASQLA
jgi:hypothetical protein